MDKMFATVLVTRFASVHLIETLIRLVLPQIRKELTSTEIPSRPRNAQMLARHGHPAYVHTCMVFVLF